jgi:hypothetical protein
MSKFDNFNNPEKTDLTNPNNLSQKVLPEQETRKRILAHARRAGCEQDIIILLNKYDRLLRNCSDDKERSDISKLGCVEIYRLLGGGGELWINNQLVIKDQ